MAKTQGISGPAVAAVLVGGIFVYAGIKGKSVADTTRALLSGENPSSAKQTYGIVGGLGSGIKQALGSAVSSANGAPGSNKELGKSLAAVYGWSTDDEWEALEELWTRESSWSNTAENGSSGAYGIPQALPYSKMPKAAWPNRFGGTSDPGTQIRWGLDYIKARYGSPSQALAFHNVNNWY